MAMKYSNRRGWTRVVVENPGKHRMSIKEPTRCVFRDDTWYLYQDEDQSFDDTARLYETGNDFET